MASTDDVKLNKEIEDRRSAAADRTAKLRDLYGRVRMRMGKSRLELRNTKPEFSYYFGNINEDEMSLYQSMGFELDRDPEVLGSLPRKEDGALVVGDAILLRMPKEEYEAIHQINLLKSEENLDAAIERLIASAERDQIPVYKIDQKGA
jgi:hypothetical protein